MLKYEYVQVHLHKHKHLILNKFIELYVIERTEN